MTTFWGSNIVNFRRGVVTTISDDGGYIRGLTAWDSQETVDIIFKSADVRFVETDTHRRYLSFGGHTRLASNDVTLETLRPPAVGDIVMYASEWNEDLGLHATYWTHEVIYKEAEDLLPRCNATKECDKAPRPGKQCCTYHAPTEDDRELESEMEDDEEDPLAGDVEPTGGYYVAPIHPFEAHRLEVMRQHGDYTG